MALFGATAPRDEALIEMLADTGPDGYRRKNALNALAACEQTIHQVQANEGLVLLVHDCSPTQVRPRVVMVTDAGVTAVMKKGIDRHLRFGEIAETSLRRHPAGMWVTVDSHKARNDFLPDDGRRLQYVIDFFAATPGAANLACSLIDRHL